MPFRPAQMRRIGLPFDLASIFTTVAMDVPYHSPARVEKPSSKRVSGTMLECTEQENTFTSRMSISQRSQADCNDSKRVTDKGPFETLSCRSSALDCPRIKAQAAHDGT
jgi:hypothetical protein